jgi:hypothetical protein
MSFGTAAISFGTAAIGFGTAAISFLLKLGKLGLSSFK